MNIANDNKIDDVKYFNNCLGQFEQVVIYGIGIYGSTVIDYMLKTGRKDKISGIVVTDTTGMSEQYRDIKISQADSFFQRKKNKDVCVIVAASLKFQNSIVMLLQKYGICKYYCLTGKGYEDFVLGGG